MNEVLAAYLQNSIRNIIFSSALSQTESFEDVVPSDEDFPSFESIEIEQSAVYGGPYEVEGTTSVHVSPLKDLENAFVLKYKNRLKRAIAFEEFVDGESNEAYELFETMLEESPITSISILSEIYWEKVKEDDVSFIVKLLNILAYCPFDKVKEQGLCLFTSAILHKNARVKAMALRVAGHWMCPELLVYLDKLDIAEYPFLEKKYLSIKTTIKEKWNMQEK